MNLLSLVIMSSWWFIHLSLRSSFNGTGLCELTSDDRVAPVVVLPASSSSSNLDSDSRMGLGIAVGILSLAVVVVLAAAAVLYKRLNRFWSAQATTLDTNSLHDLAALTPSVHFCDVEPSFVLIAPFVCSLLGVFFVCVRLSSVVACSCKVKIFTPEKT